MRYAAPVSVLALATAALAQDQIVHVGTDGSGNKILGFTPQSITASQGSVVTFVFDAPGSMHNVAQSSFATPCEPVQNGFNSGFTPGPAASGDTPATWNLTITDVSKPIWFYCAQTTGGTTHCTNGMVGAINAPAPGATNDVSHFVALASSATAVGTPSPALAGVEASASAFPTAISSSGANSQTAVGSSGATSQTAPSSGGSSTNSAAATSGTSASSGSGSAGSSSTASQSASTTGTTNNAAVGGVVERSGLVWAVAAAFGVALL
ncbi:hypothetical protein DICSQDRAFT_89642 [Dichomitus squalens LYAD-421 SS1]|uniref:Cupredoxin n=1 Tax=Dichomitus squalens (strain LYAD-421) TaxID=732165 RepID=R7ST01_DICSQ|nr:uncharacterized protein DICSQDRAFT_89642 [Dichomitus squalens LYAD-421 SS1]EJF59161.1 hypothetical protein DICSQDRAFT_89642 [Dichomitus squalens LYAD-421 SS1]